jgi:hypothetical protein
MQVSCCHSSCKSVASQQGQELLSTEAVKGIRIYGSCYQATDTRRLSGLRKLSTCCSDWLNVQISNGVTLFVVVISKSQVNPISNSDPVFIQ